MECEWKEGQYHRAKIIERRKRPDTSDYEYYVHYIGCECSHHSAVCICNCMITPALLFSLMSVIVDSAG